MKISFVSFLGLYTAILVNFFFIWCHYFRIKRT